MIEDALVQPGDPLQEETRKVSMPRGVLTLLRHMFSPGNMRKILIQSRWDPEARLRKRGGIVLKEKIVHAIWGNDVSDGSQVIQSSFGGCVATRGRMKQRGAVREADDGHPVREPGAEETDHLAVVPNAFSQRMKGYVR